jgi:two-component system, sensor histidine kinase and response regulator
VNTLLEVNCYEAGSKTLALITCDMWAIAQEVIQEVQPLANAKGIELSLSIASNVPHPSQLQLQGDCQEIRRMLTNLIANSIKFTDTGSVKVQLGLEPANPNGATPNNSVIITIEDTGFGISVEEQQTLFQRFRKGSHKQAGSGLGLHLVQRIVTVHQGSITVSSELGQGSLFTVRLPV